jgi:hypothetical protein
LSHCPKKSRALEHIPGASDVWYLFSSESL